MLQFSISIIKNISFINLSFITKDKFRYVFVTVFYLLVKIKLYTLRHERNIMVTLFCHLEVGSDVYVYTNNLIAPQVDYLA